LYEVTALKIITEPTVTVIAKQVFIEHPVHKIPADGTDAVKIGAFAAKGCYDSFGETGRANEANQRQVIEHEHGSVLEHITFTLFIEGITRGLSLESNRHRPLAVSQRSTRYTAEEDASIVLEPYYAEWFNKFQMTYDEKEWTWSCADPHLNYEAHLMMRDLLESAETSFKAYTRQVHYLEKQNPLNLTGFDLRKWARGKARNLLPHALETRITYTGNIRAWRWFIESRSDKHAEPEIRRLAHHVLQTLRAEAPLYFEDFVIAEVYDGIPMWTPTHSKV
jgi:thymidylate synthase (FAD)